MTRALKELLLSQPKTLRSAFVFTTVKGQPYGVNRLTKEWNKASSTVGIKDVTLYGGCRHSFASQLVNRGRSLAVIGEIMGHSDKRVTEKYAHVNLASMREAMEE